MMISPKVLLTEEFARLFGRKPEEPPTTTKQESHDIYHDYSVDRDGVEEIVLYVSDDIDIVLRNYNPGVPIKNLSVHDQMVLIMDGIEKTHFRDPLVPMYRPG